MPTVTVPSPGPQPEAKPREIDGGWIIAIVTVAIIGLYLIYTKPSWLCGGIEIGQNTTAWRIDNNSTVSTQILWQKTNIPGYYDGGIANSRIAVSISHVLLARDSGVLTICDTGHDVVAFELGTGKKTWNFPASLIRWIETTDDGYLLLQDTQLAEINMQGRQVWFPPYLPSRSAFSLFIANHNVYMPTSSNTYVITIGSRSLNLIEDYQILAVFDDVVVRYEGDGRIVVRNSDTEAELLSLTLPEPFNMAFFPSNFPLHVDNLDSTLLIYYGMDATKNIEAYDIYTGELLWKKEQRFDSVPIILGDTIVAYSFDNGLMLYNANDGSAIGHVVLSRTLNDNSEWRSRPVWLAGYDNTITLLFQGSGELVVLQIEELMKTA